MKFNEINEIVKFHKISEHKNCDVHCGVWLGMAQCSEIFGKLPENSKRLLCRIIYLRLDFLRQKFFFVGC